MRFPELFSFQRTGVIHGAGIAPPAGVTSRRGVFIEWVMTHKAPTEGAAPTHPRYDGTPKTAWTLNPWAPMTDPLDLKHLGKLAEEANELGSAIARCLIQGIWESHPTTGKPNDRWLEDEIADVIANTELVMDHFDLDRDAILDRVVRKMTHLRAWHAMATPTKGRQP